MAMKVLFSEFGHDLGLTGFIDSEQEEEKRAQTEMYQPLLTWIKTQAKHAVRDGAYKSFNLHDPWKLIVRSFSCHLQQTCV